MFREFNIKFEDVEMIEGADNLLEGTEVTKVIMRGDNKMSSLNATFKNCAELDRIDGEVNLDEVTGIDSMLEGANLLTDITLKNITNENISTENSMPMIKNINIGGNTYNKKALQNIISSKEWNFNGLNYKDEVLNNIYTDSSSCIDKDTLIIEDTLEQRATGLEIKGQTYENLIIEGNKEVELLDELVLESIDGLPSEFQPHVSQEVYVDRVEGQTYKNLIDGKGSYTLSNPYSQTLTEANNELIDYPHLIEVTEVWGDTKQGFYNQVTIDQLVASISNAIDTGGVTTSATKPINNGGYLTVYSANLTIKDYTVLNDSCFIQLKPNTTYTANTTRVNSTQNVGFSVYSPTKRITSSLNRNAKFTTDGTGKVLMYPNSAQSGKVGLFLVEGSHDLNLYPYGYGLDQIKSVGELYVNENEEPILDEEGNEQYKLEISSSTQYNIIPPSITYVRGDVSIANGNTSPSETNTRYYNKELIPIKPNRVYTTDVWRCTDLGNTFNGIFFYDKNGKYIGYTEVRKTNVSYTFTTPINCYYIRQRSSQNIVEGEELRRLSIVKGVYNFDGSYVEYGETDNKVAILLPQPLRSIGNGKYRDKLYWDHKNKRYVINKVVGFQKINLNDMNINLNNCLLDTSSKNTNLVKISVDDFDADKFTRVDVIDGDLTDCICDKAIGSSSYDICWNRDDISCSYDFTTDSENTTSLQLISWRVSKDYATIDSAIEYIKSLEDISFYVRMIPKIIETKVIDKIELNTHINKTFIDNNNVIKASSITVTNKRDIFVPCELKNGVKYTLQISSISENSSPITINLGGEELISIDRTSSNLNIEINTLDTLLNNTLELSGEVTIADVMLFEGGHNTIKQTVPYIDGIQDVSQTFEISTNDDDFKTIYLPFTLKKIGDKKDILYWDEDKKHYCIEQNIDDEYNVLESPNILDLVNLNQRYTLNTFTPKTELKYKNTLLKPYYIKLKSYMKGYSHNALDPNAEYTIQFYCKKKSDRNIKLNLGGSEVSISPIVGDNHVSITTNESIDSDKLFLTGYGNTISNVLIVKGEMNQYPKYFDGVQSTGELQEDGSYKIKLSSSNDGELPKDKEDTTIKPRIVFNQTISSAEPLMKGDRLYWNKSSKRYEIDRNGEIEIPVVEGDIIGLPRLYQKDDTILSVETGNIKPSKVEVTYTDIN